MKKTHPYNKILRVFALMLVLSMLVVSGAAFAANPTGTANTATAAPEGGTPAAARSYLFSAKGSIAAPDPVTLTAHIGGQVEGFDWVPGDTVADTQALVSIKPTYAYAPADGVVRQAHGASGDQVADVLALYGALCYVERDDVWHVQASTQNAYDEPENRDVKIGDVLRLYVGSGDDRVEGTGTVISKDGKKFVLEIARGEFDLEDDVNIYLPAEKDKDQDKYDSKDKVGKGEVGRPPVLPVTGAGVIAAAYAKDGQAVKRGDALYMLDNPGATYAQPAQADAGQITPALSFGYPAIIHELLVRPGQQVAQGQALMTLLPVQSLETALEVDELDIARVAVGQQVRVSVDGFSGREFVATVREIRPVGVTVLDTTKFTVMATFDDAQGLMIGMHCTGYWD